MAIFNEILVARYSRFMQKLFGMKGDVAVKQIAGEVMPVIPFFVGAEMRFLELWDRYGGVSSQPATAAVTSGSRIINPAGSNVIAVIEKVLILSSVADPGIGLDNGLTASLANPDVTRRLDSRSRAVGNLLTSHATSPVAGNQFGATGVTAGSPTDFIQTDIQEFPLLPGDGLQVRTSVVNTTLTISYVWRERFLEDSERQ